VDRQKGAMNYVQVNKNGQLVADFITQRNTCIDTRVNKIINDVPGNYEVVIRCIKQNEHLLSAHQKQ
jgi:uncharacterized protein (DUF2461 family)